MTESSDIPDFAVDIARLRLTAERLIPEITDGFIAEAKTYNKIAQGLASSASSGNPIFQKLESQFTGLAYQLTDIKQCTARSLEKCGDSLFALSVIYTNLEGYGRDLMKSAEAEVPALNDLPDRRYPD